MGKSKSSLHSRATFCRICEVACGLLADLDAGGKLVRLRPDRSHPISQGFCCAKGTQFIEVASHRHRLLHPLRRGSDGQYHHASWTEAMELISDRVRPILKQYGPHAVGIYFGNPLAFNTLGALTMLGFMRALGTRNVFTAGSQDCNNKFAGSQILHGSPLIHPIPDFAHADFALMLGTNPAISQSSFVHLEGGSRVFDQMQSRGARLVWVDPRFTESARRWGEHLPIRPGTDVFLLLALLYECRDLYRADMVSEGLDTLLACAEAYTPETAGLLCRIEPNRIRELARSIRQVRCATFHMSVGVNQGPFGTLSYIVLQALAYLTGHFDHKGGLVIHPVAVGLAEVGRWIGLARPRAGSRVGACQNVLFSLPAGIMADEILTSGPEQIRALIVVSGNPLKSVPGGERLQRALRTLDLLVSVDLFQNETGCEADIVLPATSWLERWDVANTTLMFQQAPLMQYAAAVQPAPGETRSEVRILADMSVAMGRPLWRQNAIAWLWARLRWDDLFTWISQCLSWSVLFRFRGVQGWLAPRPRPGRYRGRGPRTPGHRLRFWHTELDGEPERLQAYCETLQSSVHEFQPSGFTLICRRRRLGHNSWLHGAVPKGEAEEEAWFAPQDLAALGLPSGGEVRLQTRVGSIHIRAVPVVDVAPGVVVVPHGLPHANINALIPSGGEMLEPLSGQHRLTGIPVRVTVRHPVD